MRWQTVLVAACVVVDVAVLGAAYALATRPSDGADSAGSAAARTSQTAPAGSAGTRSTPSDDPDSGSGAATPRWRGPVLMAVAPSGRLVRVARGSCDARDPHQARVWVADRFRAPLREVSVPGLQEVLGVTVGGGRITVVGTGKGCKASGFVSEDAGRTWQRGGVPDDVWYLDPDSTSVTLRGPVKGGGLSLDCAPVSVTTLDGGARALASCQSGNVELVRRDRPGRRSPTSFLVTAPVAAAETGAGDALALVADPSCPAALMRLTTQRSGVRRACFGADDAPLGLAATGERVYVQVGYRLLLSTDGGVSFAPYRAS